MCSASPQYPKIGGDGMNVVLTGATGFVGAALLPRLMAESGMKLTVATRRDVEDIPRAVRQVQVGELTAQCNWDATLSGADVVVHLAARVHVMHDKAADPLAEFRRVNVDGTLNLARQTAAAGVRRFVFLSSVKVNGEGGGKPYREDDPPSPQDAYGISKHEAEQGLWAVARETGLEVTVIRPPLVYGPGVRANFAALMRAVGSGVPLPLGAVDNRRSLVAVDNLADFIATCVVHPQAGDATFLVSDGEDLSTPELVGRLARAMNRPVRLLPVPPRLLKFAGRLAGRRAAVERLCGSLQVDIERARTRLGWSPPVDVDEALRRTVSGQAVGRTG